MIFSDTIEGAVARLFFFDKTTQSKRFYTKEENSGSYGHCGCFLALGVCLFLGLKVVFKRYFPGKKTSQTEISKKKTNVSELTNETNTQDSRHHENPFRSMQLPRAVRKLLQEDSLPRSTSTTETYNVRAIGISPQKIKNPTAEVSIMSESSTRYLDAVSSLGQSLKGPNSQKGAIKVSMRSPQGNPLRKHTAKFPPSSNVASQVSHSLVAQGDSKVSQLPQEQRGQNIEAAQSQSTKGILSEEQDCNTQRVGDLQVEMKLPLNLTYRNSANVTQKMRSTFSRSKLGKKWSPEQNSSDDVRFEDGTCRFTSGKLHLGQEINTTSKATTRVNKNRCGNLGKDLCHVQGLSPRETQKLAARSRVKKKSAVHFGNEKRYSAGSLADVYTSLMCLNNTHKALTAPVMEKEGFHDGRKPAGRKWKKGDKTRLEAIDMSYKSCPSKAPIVFEIFPFEAFEKTATGKIDRHCQINEAGLDNRRALKRNRKISVSKDGHNEAVSMDILKIVATKMKPTDFKESKSSTLRFEKRRKRNYSEIQMNALGSKTKDSRGLVDLENDRCSSFVETDISVCVERTVLHSTKGNHKRHGLKQYDICQTATELNLAKNEPGIYRDKSDQRTREVPPTSNAHTEGKHKNSTAFFLHDPRAESIRMVESLISVTGVPETSSSGKLGATDRSVCHNLESRKGMSIAFSMATAETQQHTKPITIPALVETDVCKTHREKKNIKNKNAVKKNLRFAANTEIYGASNPMSNVQQTSPARYNRSQKNAMPKFENTVVDKIYASTNKTHQKCAQSSNDYPKLFDKLDFEHKDNFENALRIYQSTEPSRCEAMHREPQSPDSVRVQKSRSRTRPYTTLTSFLDHKEKEHNSLKDMKTGAENLKGLAIKHTRSADVRAAETQWARKDTIVSEGDFGMMDCLNGFKLCPGVGDVETEGTLKNTVSGPTCSNWTMLSEQQRAQKQNVIAGLHFGTNNLQLYSESVDSVSSPKKDSKTNKDMDVLLSRKDNSRPKQQTGMKYVPFSSTEYPHKLRRPIKEAKGTAAHTTTVTTASKRFRRNSFRVIKKDVIKKINTRENISLPKVASSVQNKKLDLQTVHHKSGNQCIKNNIRTSLMKANSKTYGINQSLFAIPDPTRGFENVAETEYLKHGCGDSLKEPDAQMATAEHKTEEFEHAPAFDAPEIMDTFKDIINLEQPTLKSQMSGKSVILSSSSKTRSVELSSPYKMHALSSVSPAHLGSPMSGKKSLYPCGNTMTSPNTKIPLILKAEQSKTIALEPLQVDNTPPRIRKRIRRLKSCSLGHVFSKLSEKDSKPPRGDAFRDTDQSSTSRSVTSVDINALQTTKSTATETKDQIPVIVTKLIFDPAKHRSDTLQRTPSSGKQNSSGTSIDRNAPQTTKSPATETKDQIPVIVTKLIFDPAKHRSDTLQRTPSSGKQNPSVTSIDRNAPQTTKSPATETKDQIPVIVTKLIFDPAKHRSDTLQRTPSSGKQNPSVTSIDRNAPQTTKSPATETKDQIPVIVTKLIFDPAKHRSGTLQRTSSSGKQYSSQEEPAVQNRLRTSFSHSHQPLQSIRRGSLKDIFDRYVVHTSEFPQRNTAKITGTFMRPTKKAENDAHLPLTDQDASTRSPMVTSYQVKQEVSQRNISSYTSKYRANDSSDKSVKSSWRGTVAFRKRLQHLLQHNKHIQNKYKHINMATDKASSVDLSDGKLNLSSASKNKLGNIYKVSRVMRPGRGVLGQISEKKQDIRLSAQEPGKTTHIYSAHNIVTPVSKLLDMRDQLGDVNWENRKEDVTEMSTKSPLQDKTRSEQNIVSLITSPHFSNPLDTSTFASPQKVTHSSKSIITHSDHFEQKVQYQLKRQSEAMEHKLSQMRANFETQPVTCGTRTRITTKSSIPCLASNRKVFCSLPRVARLQRQSEKIKGKQQKTIHTVADIRGKDMVAENERVNSAKTQVVDSPYTVSPRIHKTSHSEDTVAETVTAKLHNTVEVVGVNSNHSVHPGEIHAEVTRFDFFTANEEQVASAGDTGLNGTIKQEMAHKKEMARASETEQNLQMLLDKIKHRSFLTSPAAKTEKGKGNFDASAGIAGSPDINIDTIKQIKRHPKLGSNQLSIDRLPHMITSNENHREIKEQTNCSFTTDEKTVVDISEIVPLNLGRTQKESARGKSAGVEITRMYEGKKKTDHHVATKTASNTESTVKNIQKVTIVDKRNNKHEGRDNIKTEETVKASVSQVIYQKYRLMPRNRAKRATSSMDKKSIPEIENCTTSESNGKHVVFNLNDHVDQSNMESFGTIISEVEAQKSSDSFSGSWSKEISGDNADKIHSHSPKTGVFHNKVRKAMSVFNILSLDEFEKADKNAPRKDSHADLISETSHTYEKQQSSTEATGKLPCSSGYGTMDIVSTTSFSQLQNSPSVEPGQLMAESEMVGDVCIPGTYKDTDDDQLIVHDCKQKDFCHETCERVGQVSSLATSFWKKEIRMDVIKEEEDYENVADSQTDVESGKSKLIDFGMKKSEVEKVNLEYTASQEYVAQNIVTDKTAFETTSKAEVKDINNESNTAYQERCEEGEKSEDYRVINSPVHTQNFDENYMEICDSTEHYLQLHLNKRMDVSDICTTREVSHNAEEIVCNQSDIASENSPANDTCVPGQANEDFLNSPHLYKAVAETLSQIGSTHAQLMNNIVAEDESYSYSLHAPSRAELLPIEIQNTALDCLPFTNKKESQCEEINELNAVINSGSNVVHDKDSLSVTTEPESERPDPSNHQTYSLMFAKTLDSYHEISQSKSDSTAAKHEVGVCDFMSTTEISKQSVFLGEKNKSDLTTVPIKSTTYDVQGMKSFSSMAEQSRGSSDNSFTEVFKCTDDQDATLNKPPHKDINTQSISKTAEIVSQYSHKEDTDVQNASQTVDTLRIEGSSSQTGLPNSDDDDTFPKLSEPNTANILAHMDSTISQNKTSVQGGVQFLDKLTPDLHIDSVTSSCSETVSDCNLTVPVQTTTLDNQPAAGTQTSELDFCSGDGVKKQTSVGLQVGHAVDDNSRSFTDNSGSSWNREVVLKTMVSHVSSTAEVSKAENHRKEETTDTSSRKEKTCENDKSAVTTTLEKNINENKERSALKAEITQEHRCVVRTSRQRAPSEGIGQSVMDDLESLLNQELGHVNADGGLRQASDVNRLFGTYERNRRREKRRKQTEKTLSQSPSHRELQYHFLRENDGSVKRSSSNTSQRTVFSPSDTGTQHPSRAIRPLALGRVTKLEEFLQRAEELNRSETTSNVSRAVSKLSSFTSVTLSSQEEQLTCQARSGKKATRHKQRALETESNISHTASEINTMGSVSRKCSQLSRVKDLKDKTCENEHHDSKCATCTSANEESHFPDGISDCSKNKDNSRVKDAGCSLLNMAADNTAEQKHVSTYSSQISSGGYCSHIKMTVVSGANDSMESRIAYTDTGNNTCMIKNETSMDIHTSDAACCRNYSNKQFIEQQYPTATIATALATDSTISSSSSSIVLSWIGSDLGDTEELMISPNLTDKDDKLYSDDVTEFSNYHLQTHQTNDTHQFPQAAGNTKQLFDECHLQELFSGDASKLRRSTFNDSVSHSSPLTVSTLQKSDRRMSGYTVYDNNEKSRISYLGENVGNYKLTKIKQNKKMSPMRTSLPSTGHTLFENHKKDDRQTSQAMLSSSNYFKCPQKEKYICSPASPKTSKKLCSFWNSNPTECTLEQPSYFNALLRDPKWNPSFEIKEGRNKTGHHTEEPSTAGRYVQSAWTYQQVRNISPNISSPQKGQECNSSTHSHTIKQQSEAHDRLSAHVVSSISGQRSNTNISFDIRSIHSNESDPHSRQYPANKTSPRNDIIIQCPEQHSGIQLDKENQKDNTNIVLSQDLSIRRITKQNTFLRKVHFDSNFERDNSNFEPTIKPVSQSQATIYEMNNKSTKTRPLDKYLKTSTRSGVVHVKDRLPLEQQSQGTESTKTKTKMSLEQHLCSTFDTGRNAMSKAAQPCSENGTTKSTSSHASLNWYKPQSLPSSTSDSNGNTSHSHQEESNQHEILDSQERACQPRTPHSEIGKSPSKRRSTAESIRRQDTHTIEHSMINNQDLTSCLLGSTHEKISAQKNTFCLGTQRKLLTEKGTSESLLTPSSTLAKSSEKRHIPGLWWLRDPDSSRETKHILPQPACGNNSRVNESKSGHRLPGTSNHSRTGSKISGGCEVRASTNQTRGLNFSNRKSHIVSNSLSPHSLSVNSEKGSGANNNRARKVGSNHVQSLRKSRCSSYRSATNYNLEPRTNVDIPDTTMNGTKLRTESLATKLSNRCASQSRHFMSADPVSPFKGTRRVSKLVELFEKKLES